VCNSDTPQFSSYIYIYIYIYTHLFSSIHFLLLESVLGHAILSEQIKLVFYFERKKIKTSIWEFEFGGFGYILLEKIQFIHEV
jgi:hypothetical protein